MTPDEDFSEADTTTAEFDAMWDEGEPVATVAGWPRNLVVSFGQTIVVGPRGLTTADEGDVTSPEGTVVRHAPREASIAK